AMFEDVGDYLWLIPTLPLLAAAVIALFGKYLKDLSHWPCVLAIGISAFLSFNVLLAVKDMQDEQAKQGEHDQHARHLPPAKKSVHYYDFIKIPTRRTADTPIADIGLALRADALSAIMLTTVTFVGFFIAVFAIGYMAHDPGYPRFFG